MVVIIVRIHARNGICGKKGGLDTDAVIAIVAELWAICGFNQNKARRRSINRSVPNAVLDFAKESTIFVPAPERPQAGVKSRGFNAGLHRAKTSFICNLVTIELNI
jgi:hypothetical protein